jgi:hypothetical protein
MKTLSLIIATGATLALLAPTAGAKNTLNCATTRQAASSSQGTATTSPYSHQVTRNLLYFGTWRPQPHASKSCKSLQSAKSGASHITTPSSRLQVDRDSL